MNIKLDVRMDVLDKINDVAISMNGLTALLHAAYEGIKTDNVGLDEVIEAINCLYKTVECLNYQIQQIKDEICP